MRYQDMSGLPTEFNHPENWALGFCVSNFLADVKEHRYHEAFDRLFNGEGYSSDEGWELCRPQQRYLGSEVELPPTAITGLFVWTDPDDFGYEPNWRVYSEEELQLILRPCCIKCHAQAGRAYDTKLMDALDAFLPLRTSVLLEQSGVHGSAKEC